MKTLCFVKTVLNKEKMISLPSLIWKKKRDNIKMTPLKFYMKGNEDSESIFDSCLEHYPDICVGKYVLGDNNKKLKVVSLVRFEQEFHCLLSEDLD